MIKSIKEQSGAQVHTFSQPCRKSCKFLSRVKLRSWHRAPELLSVSIIQRDLFPGGQNVEISLTLPNHIFEKNMWLSRAAISHKKVDIDQRGEGADPGIARETNFHRFAEISLQTSEKNSVIVTGKLWIARALLLKRMR